MKKYLKPLILILVVILSAAVLAVAYFKMVKENKSFDWQSFSFVHKFTEVEHDFTFDCPVGWKIQDNLDYDGKVKTKQCVLDNNKPGSFSFDDGVVVTFKFIPNSVIESEKEYFNKKENVEIKYYDIIKNYQNNNFIGKIGQNKTGYELYVLARTKVNDGIYEVEASSYTSEQTKNDQEGRKATIDQIISSFKVIK